MKKKTIRLPKELKFDRRGLIPAIIQDYRSGEVLMLGYLNREALRKTIETGRTCFYSRSRRRLWHKGETSGHTQTVKGIYFDCDGDVLLIKAAQRRAACHSGYRSCFFRRWEGDTVKVVGRRVFDPEKVYRRK